MNLRFFLKKIYHRIKIYTEFINEGKNFSKYYTYASENKSNLEYKLLILSHSIEKGLCIKKNVRPFGDKKILEIIDTLKIYHSKGYDNSFSINLTLNILNKYKEFYEEHNFVSEKIYYIVTEILERFNDYDSIECGAKEYTYTNDSINYNKLLDSRHSVRSFSDNDISKGELDYAINCAIKSPSACNRQMVKVYCFLNKNKNKIELINKYAQGLSGFDTKNINYFIITYDVSAFLFPGEKNQGMFNAGLFCTNLVNALHNKGIGSCFIQYANSLKEEKNMKMKLGIPESERVAVLIAFGKYEDKYFIPKSARKNITDILKMAEEDYE